MRWISLAVAATGAFFICIFAFLRGFDHAQTVIQSPIDDALSNDGSIQHDIYVESLASGHHSAFSG